MGHKLFERAQLAAASILVQMIPSPRELTVSRGDVVAIERHHFAKPRRRPAPMCRAEAPSHPAQLGERRRASRSQLAEPLRTAVQAATRRQTPKTKSLTGKLNIQWFTSIIHRVHTRFVRHILNDGFLARCDNMRQKQAHAAKPTTATK